MAYFFIGLAIILRLVPHAPNFAPIAALALFGAVYLNKKYSIILPVAALIISDFFIGFYSWKILASVYISFGLVGLIGLWVRKNKKVATVIGGTLAGSVLFYIVTNFAVWAFTAMYPHTLQGLITCYAVAIPFFRNTLMGDLFYVGLFFGSYELAMALSARKAQAQKA
ncbi:hypothetical protein LCGC14_0847940 [marine sediment metagenome]|uniref:Uncharacterized protein n=1 Tax=marine sediment metagenome TaxID=412755 RepID=A0A0F9PWH4_9ZZZZ|nr:hypothetical protein [Actinomycetota bacterium]